ncbi:MAG: DUF4384 domain-containing protein [Syntrophobacteraceae bacterium]
MKFKKSSIVPVVFVLLFFQPVSTPGGAWSLSFAAQEQRSQDLGIASPVNPANPVNPVLQSSFLLDRTMPRPLLLCDERLPSGPVAYPEVDFRWAFAAKTSHDGKSSTQPVTQDMALKSGDQVKMMVELQRKCFVYLFHDNRRDSVKLLFPYALQQFEIDYQPERRYYIPRGEAWFRLDENRGQEIFYLVASPKRLDELEKAFLRHESAEAASKAETARALVDLIRELRRQHRELSSPAERPVPIGGALRSVEKAQDPNLLDIAAFADEILSTGFVARTYTIEHN